MFLNQTTDSYIALDEIGDDRFESREPAEERHVFGGLLIAQALRAAQLTVIGRSAHSLHASFVLAEARRIFADDIVDVGEIS